MEAPIHEAKDSQDESTLSGRVENELLHQSEFGVGVSFTDFYLWLLLLVSLFLLDQVLLVVSAVHEYHEDPDGPEEPNSLVKDCYHEDE